MSTVTPAATYPVTGAFDVNPAYSGTFIPAIWSNKLLVKFYASTTFGDVSNTDYEGDISNVGDKVIINTVPDITINDYVVGGTLDYQTPVGNTIELLIDQGKYFGINVNDVMEYQAQPNLMDMFTSDAANQMKIAIDRECFLATFDGAAPENQGTSAGARSGSYNLGSDLTPLALTADNILETITAMASVLDEQNVPESDRFLIFTPQERNLLMSSRLAQADFMGDSSSIVRNGKIGMIDRFQVYVSNLLPTAALGQDFRQEPQIGAPARHVMLGGQKSALTFASQINKVENIPNPNDFGTLIRGLMVYGRKVIKPEALVTTIVAG